MGHQPLTTTTLTAMNVFSAASSAATLSAVADVSGGGGGGGSGSGKSALSAGRAPSIYHQKALAAIRNSLLPFANSGEHVGSSSAASTISILSTTSGVSSASGLSAGSASSGSGEKKDVSGGGHTGLAFSEEINHRSHKRFDHAPPPPPQQTEPSNGLSKAVLSQKLMRKPSLEREVCLLRGSPALDSGAGSSRSDSPHAPLSRQYSPSNYSEPPPPPPPRCSSTPPPPNPYPNNVPTSMQQRLKRMSPAPVVPSRPPAVLPNAASAPPIPPQRGTSPVAAAAAAAAPSIVGSRQPMVVQNGPQAQQQLTQQMHVLSLYQGSAVEPPPPYPLGTSSSPGPPPPPSYTVSLQNRQSPTQDYRKSPSSGIYSAPNSTGSASPITVSSGGTPTCNGGAAVARPTPLQAWGARQAKTTPPFIMQSVKSTQVQKPVLQTAIAPTAPQQVPPPPSYASSIQQKHYPPKPTPATSPPPLPPVPSSAAAVAASTPPPTGSPVPATVLVPTTEPPSYASTMQALAMQKAMMPPAYSAEDNVNRNAIVAQSESSNPTTRLPKPTEPVNCSPNNNTKNAANVNPTGNTVAGYKVKHQSPIPERKQISKEKEEERRDCKVKSYSPQAYKFFMEQHVENVLKNYHQRQFRRAQLETEMNKIGLHPDCQSEMRKMLSQKESNYIRLKRAKMDKSMFKKIKTIGVGAFGEVTLVTKIDTNHLYAMKTLRKADVLKRNQVAHVKAERDILAEADNEWVVKLYYSFQDKDNLYFVMDFIPGGDLMSLLIKLGVFEEELARFYIAELTCAVESVHKMGFIHRDIKPDNILIDRDGHIKLTDFGLCTGFRWTHDSKYYQRNGEHGRQDSMDPSEKWQLPSNNGECSCPSSLMKPLERRRRRQHQRCLAHSLVGTPNYIAPEVLQRTGYTQLCDWWSVGVILYEMLVGSPPFLANTPAETQYKVINWKHTLHIPPESKLSPASTDLILKLCTDAEHRIGHNAVEIKSHPFFAGVDFNAELRRQRAPYLPPIHHPMDTSNFDPVDPDKLRPSNGSDAATSASSASSRLINKCDDDGAEGKSPFHGFFEFTFRRFFDDGGGPPYRINLSDNDAQGPVYV